MKKKQKILLTVLAGTLLSNPFFTLADQPSTSSKTANQEHRVFTSKKVLGLQVLHEVDTDPKVLRQIEESLTQGLDQNTDLVTYMLSNGYRVVAMNRAYDIDNLDENEYPEEKTAQVSPQGMHADTYLTEPLRLIAQARMNQLKELSQKGEQAAELELQRLKNAITILQNKGFTLESDDEDEVDTTDYIVTSEMVLAGQFPAFFDRITGVLEATLRKVAENESRPFNKDELDKELERYKPWYNATPDSFRQQAPEMCEWLFRNHLHSTSQVIPSTPIPIEDEYVEDFLRDPFDYEE